MARRRPVETAATAAPHDDAPAARAGEQAGRLVVLGPDWLPLALLVGDAVIVAASVLGAYWYYVNVDPLRRAAGAALPLGPYVAAIPVVIVIYIFSLAINGQYQSWRGRTLMDLVLSLYSGVGLAAVLILAAIALVNLGVDYSRLTLTYVVLLSAVLMTVERYFLRQYETRLRRQGIGTEKVLLVGTGPGSELLLRRMAMFPQYGYQVRAVLDDNLPAGSQFAGVPVVGRVDDLPAKARELAADQVFIAMADHDRGRVAHLIKQCEDQQIDFKVIPDLLDIMSTRTEVNSLDGLPLIGVRHSRLTGLNSVVKRAIDIVVSAVALIILAVPMLVVALLIKITSRKGPVLFTQERIGMGRKPFVVYKFRTMIPDAEAATGPKVALPDDPRTTSFGRFMRKISIDELPQLWNVLRGDMSLVGPRPQPTYFDEQYSADVPRYLERQQVRPGLTGWAEVNDLRGAAPIVDRTVYDVYYIENWSLVLDIKIIILTALRLFFQRHAY
ncbi:MAG: undecaprenyl-phosphate glucose phosphotransferase [Chloroflexi bacterium]|nr:MAG: undecaprenyl-phosphate glucose phosphotransferase [Chloroflexota bacterium]